MRCRLNRRWHRLSNTFLLFTFNVHVPKCAEFWCATVNLNDAIRLLKVKNTQRNSHTLIIIIMNGGGGGGVRSLFLVHRERQKQNRLLFMMPTLA